MRRHGVDGAIARLVRNPQRRAVAQFPIPKDPEKRRTAAGHPRGLRPCFEQLAPDRFQLRIFAEDDTFEVVLAIPIRAWPRILQTPSECLETINNTGR